MAILLLTALQVGCSENLDPGWRVFDAEDKFSFIIPHALKDTGSHGIDSYVVQFRSDDFELEFDYGPYSGHIGQFESRVGAECRATVVSHEDCDICKFEYDTLTVRDGLVYSAAIAFPRDVWSLTMVARYRHAADSSIAIKVFHSLEFKDEYVHISRALNRSR